MTVKVNNFAWKQIQWDVWRDKQDIFKEHVIDLQYETKIETAIHINTLQRTRFLPKCFNRIQFGAGVYTTTILRTTRSRQESHVPILSRSHTHTHQTWA